MIQYLFGRGIDYQLIQKCIADGMLYESADYHNAVFISKDESGTPKYAALRGTLGSTFKQDASGSDKRYSFRLLTKKPAYTVHLFEAAIDLLFYATYPQDTAHARIYNRLLEMCVPVSCIGVSFRKETAQEKLERLKLLIG